MKKLLGLILAFVIAFSCVSLAGCDNDDDNYIATTPTIKQDSTTTTTENSTTTTERETTTTTTPTTTTTTTKPTTTTTRPTTTIPAEDLMLNNSKHIVYMIDNTDRPTLFGTVFDDAMYRMITSYDECRNLLTQAAVWYSAIERFEEWSGEEFRSAFDEYTREFFEKNNLLLIENPSEWQRIRETCIKEICISDGTMKVYIYENSQGFMADSDCTLFFIPVPKEIASEVDDVVIDIDMEEWDGMIGKPVIYLYPEQETEAFVRLGYKDKITVSYPEYVNGWSVTAQPDGKLVYNETGRKLYSLYYESKLVTPFSVESDGFVVRGSDVAVFLEEKLAILGLNEYEAEEFIIYWLPILQANEYNYIRFATAEEIEHNMPLEINPSPDTVIRVWMTFKGIDEPISVTEQQLTSPERTGFVAVEWGGTEIY